MHSVSLETAIQSFRESGYDIVDERFDETGDVMIWSKDPVTPRLGDLYLIETAGEVHELAVYTLTTFRGGWSVTCRAEG
jgi:hypothetical protein